MALPTNLTLPWTTWRNPCPKRSPGKNLGQKPLCQAIVFSCVMSWVCWRNLSLAVPLSAPAESLPVPRTGGGLALLSLGLPHGAK